jgi:hypothetical protein
MFPLKERIFFAKNIKSDYLVARVSEAMMNFRILAKTVAPEEE